MKRLRLDKESGKLSYDNVIDKAIVGWLKTESEPQTFGQIREFLKKNKTAYKNMDSHRATLAGTLKRLIRQNKIEKIRPDRTHIYPRYTAVGKSMFNTAFDGYAFKSELLFLLLKPMSHRELDEDLENLLGKTIGHKKQWILNLVSAFGIYVLFTLLASYKRPIQEGNSNKENFANREIWLLNALDLEIPPASNRPSRQLATLLIEGFLKSEQTDEWKYDLSKELEDNMADSFIQKQIEDARTTMKQLFPLTMKWMASESKGKLLSDYVRDEFRKSKNPLSRIREDIP